MLCGLWGGGVDPTAFLRYCLLAYDSNPRLGTAWLGSARRGSARQEKRGTGRGNA